jgi:hypothetical protein
MVAGSIAGEQAVVALESGDTSSQGLWGYATGFMRGPGATYASHEVVRWLVCSLSKADLAFLAEEYIKADALIESIAGGNLLPSVVSGAQRLASLARRPALVAQVLRANRVMSAVRQHYLRYPETPRALEAWARRAARLRRPIQS